MIYNVNTSNLLLSSLKNYKRNRTENKKTDNSTSIIDFDLRSVNKDSEKATNAILFALSGATKEVKKEQNNFTDSSTTIQNEDGSSTEITRFNGTEKKITRYGDGSYDEIYNSTNGISYMRVKRYTSKDDYTEVYQDSTGFCGKETFTKLPDGTSISSNEFSNGKKYTETYKVNPDGGFTRKLENNDGTGYTETKAFKEDGSSSYSIENEDGSGNTVIYNPDGSYVEILTDSNGKTTINKFD